MTRTLSLLLLAALVVGSKSSDADDSGGTAPEPLYLHWYKAEYPNGHAAIHLATVRVHPGSRANVSFPDPTLPARTCLLRGDVRRAEDGFDVDVTASWRSGTRFKGRFALDVPREGHLGWFSGAYWPTTLVVTRDPSPKEFLGRANSNQPIENEPGETE